MRVQCDDELYRVNRTFLGPKGKPWPLRATYRAWGITAGLFVGIVFVWRLIGLPWHFLLAIGALVAAYGMAKWLDRHLTVDRPVSAEVTRVVQELWAPRPDLDPKPTTYSHSFHVNRWRADAPPEVRWWARLGAWCGSVPGRVAGKVTGRKDGRVYVEGEWRDVR